VCTRELLRCLRWRHRLLQEVQGLVHTSRVLNGGSSIQTVVNVIP
jgi:hypothetical protein